MKRKTCLSFLVIFIFLAQCSKNSARTRSFTPTTRIQWDTAGILSTINDSDCSNFNCLQHATFVMDGLFKLLWLDGEWNLQKSLADKFEINKRGITITIKQNVKWSDGNILTAAHFVTGWKKFLSNCQTLEQFPAWKNVPGLVPYCKKQRDWNDVGVHALAGVNGADSNQIEILSDRQGVRYDQEILRSLAHPGFYPVAPRRRDSSKQLATLGPYLVAEETDGLRSVHYTINPDYHGAAPKIGSVTLRGTSSIKSALSASLSGQLQLAGPLSDEDGAENLDPARKLVLPADGRWAVAIQPAGAIEPSGAMSAWDYVANLDWNEPQKLALPNALPCTGHALCASTVFEPITTKAPKAPPPPVAVVATDAAAKRIAENIAAQWRAHFQGRIQVLPKFPGSTSQANRPVPIRMEVLAFQTNPFQSRYPSVDLWNACLPVVGPAKLARPAVNATESEVRKFERRLWAPPRCIPIAVRTRIFVRDPQLEKLAWTAFGTLDFSSATYPPPTPPPAQPTDAKVDSLPDGT